MIKSYECVTVQLFSKANYYVHVSIYLRLVIFEMAYVTVMSMTRGFK